MTALLKNTKMVAAGVLFALCGAAFALPVLRRLLRMFTASMCIFATRLFTAHRISDF